jgi:hypothetical protein
MTMPRKKQEQWISGREAMVILKRNSGREDIADSYLRLLARQGKIESRPIDGRTNEYKLSDVEAYRVERRSKQHADSQQEQEQKAQS